ncbi:cytochrome-c peroxidase [Hyunsoonleella ulvae]|uniref:cytochrome-c peroxidase n=1 Tax=Hyunsoonleella ulvae TaxID=2799948 RepID=UPI001939E512|nr:cytochrome c peroxidase [Hyunsoonleella ulvae]
MNALKIFSVLLVFVLIVSSCAVDNDDYVETPITSLLEKQIQATAGSKTILILPASNDFNAIPSDLNNSITMAKVKLGQLLFHETALGKNPSKAQGMNTYSCASCHHAAAGFQSGIQQGIGDGGIGFGNHGEGRLKSPDYLEADLDVQPIKSPSILNSAFQEVMLWNGQFGAIGANIGTEANWTTGTPKEANTFGFEGVETQAIAGLDVHRLIIEEDFIINSDYKALFDVAFPNVLENERYTKLNAALAIAAYERTVLASEAPFQKWLKGDENAMNDDEMEGGILFFGKGKCYSCHSGPGLNGMEFHALGMKDLAGSNIMTEVDEATKKGRGGFTGNPDDDYKFKTPQLYNLTDAGFYGHGGSFKSIREIISYKNNAIAENTDVPSNKLSSQFQPLNLTEYEVDLLTSFVENALYDNNLKRYQPESLPTGNCFPNADAQSSIDMGCN